MAKGERVFVVEDDDYERRRLGYDLKEADHVIVAEAKTKEEAMMIVPTLGDLGVRAAIVDGNLTEGVGTGKDGREVTERIKDLYGDEIAVISHTRGEPDLCNGDFYVSKDVWSGREVAEIITGLLPIEIRAVADGS